MKDFYGGQWIRTENLQEKNGINYLKLGLFICGYLCKKKKKKKKDSRSLLSIG